MFCHNRAPSPFQGFSWTVLKAALAFDNLRLKKETADKESVAKLVAHMREFATDTTKFKDPPWVVYYANVFLEGKDWNVGVSDLQKLVHDKADEIERALGDPEAFVPMRKFCLRLHDRAIYR
jgi:hypothetical protein